MDGLTNLERRQQRMCSDRRERCAVVDWKELSIDGLPTLERRQQRMCSGHRARRCALGNGFSTTASRKPFRVSRKWFLVSRELLLGNGFSKVASGFWSLVSRRRLQASGKRFLVSGFSKTVSGFSKTVAGFSETVRPLPGLRPGAPGLTQLRKGRATPYGILGHSQDSVRRAPPRAQFCRGFLRFANFLCISTPSGAAFAEAWGQLLTVIFALM